MQLAAHADLSVIEIIELGVKLKIPTQIIAQPHAKLALHGTHAHSSIAHFVTHNKVELVGLAYIIATHIQEIFLAGANGHA